MPIIHSDMDINTKLYVILNISECVRYWLRWTGTTFRVKSGMMFIGAKISSLLIKLLCCCDYWWNSKQLEERKKEGKLFKNTKYVLCFSEKPFAWGSVGPGILVLKRRMLLSTNQTKINWNVPCYYEPDKSFLWKVPCYLLYAGKSSRAIPFCSNQNGRFLLRKRAFWFLISSKTKYWWQIMLLSCISMGFFNLKCRLWSVVASPQLDL